MNNTQNYTVITGASSGIGYAAAKAFARRSKNLIVVARRKAQLEELQQEIREQYPTVDVVVKVCDLSIPANVYQLYQEVKKYPIETWINNAGFGNYDSVAHQDLIKIETLLRVNVEALTLLSSLYVRDYKDIPGTQLINISSRGGYCIVPNAVTYCAAKFYVSAFTEGLAHELRAERAELKAKVLAPAATQTEFGKIANDAAEYDYDKSFGHYHTSEQMADLLMALYDSNEIVGAVDGETFAFSFGAPIFNYAGDSLHNQKAVKGGR
ncbi:MAG: isfD [Firmicutes bacterium]|nr:isfD [Bacillota bacterium]